MLVPELALAEAGDEKTIAEIPASGMIFKDTIKLQRFSDPKVKGVVLYVSDFQRPITERLAKDFFSDPTQAALTCVRTGQVLIPQDLANSAEGEEVFSQARALLFKSIKVRRIYDRETNTLIYLSYSQRMNKQDDENKSRFKTNLCAIPVDGQISTVGAAPLPPPTPLPSPAAPIPPEAEEMFDQPNDDAQAEAQL